MCSRVAGRTIQTAILCLFFRAIVKVFVSFREVMDIPSQFLAILECQFFLCAPAKIAAFIPFNHYSANLFEFL